MTEIYLVRHTQAEGNLYRMMQGHWDGDVTPKGILQTDALAERFRDVHLDAVYSSDLYRARFTASALTRFNGLEIRQDPRFREINVGPWETHFFGNVFHDFPDEAKLFMYDSEKWEIDGAETFSAVRDRAYGALSELGYAHDGQTIAVVSHGVTIRCILSRVLMLPLSDITGNPICGNTAVSKLIFSDGEFSVEYKNDTSHLGELGAKKWSSCHDLRDVPFNPASDPDYYRQCYADAWRSAHGDCSRFDAERYLKCAQLHSAAHRGAVLRIKDGEEDAGLVELDTRRGEAEGYGWISLLYLNEEYRYRGYGIQVLGRPIREYRSLGRKTVRLSVSTHNTPAIGFYEKNGFHVIKREQAPAGELLIMEKDIGGRSACTERN